MVYQGDLRERGVMLKLYVDHTCCSTANDKPTHACMMDLVPSPPLIARTGRVIDSVRCSSVLFEIAPGTMNEPAVSGDCCCCLEAVTAC